MKWEKYRLENIVSFKTGKLNSNAAIENGTYPFFTCSKEVYRTNTTAFNTEAVILGGNNAVGDYPLFYFNGEFDAYQRTYIIEPLDLNTLNIRFLYYNLRPRLKDFQNYSTGASTKFLTLKILNSVEVNLPPLPTQRKIASILSAYDDLIENNLKRIKLLEEKAFLRYKLIVKSEKFQLKAFNEVANYINGYPFKPDDWKEEGIPIIKIKELKAGIQNDTPRNDGENIPDKYLIENKDILFAWSASIGAYLWSSGKAILNQHIFNVKSFDKDLHNWLYFSLLERIPDFINLSNGATMQHIKKSALGMVFLPVPPKDLYQEFQKETDPILDLIVNLSQQNAKLREARDILLPRLMNGEIEV